MSFLFSDSDALAHLNDASRIDFDDLDFGVIAMSSDGVVIAYNLAEAALSGLTRSRVIGRNFFNSVAPCTNNYMVAQRFELESELDATIDYVFTLRMAPTPVRLRLLRSASSRHMYLLVERRTTRGR